MKHSRQNRLYSQLLDVPHKSFFAVLDEMIVCQLWKTQVGLVRLILLEERQSEPSRAHQMTPMAPHVPWTVTCSNSNGVFELKKASPVPLCPRLPALISVKSTSTHRSAKICWQ